MCVWVAALGWASFVTLAIVWLVYGSAHRILSDKQQVVMRMQGAKVREMDEVITKLLSVFNTVFGMKKVELYAKLVAQGQQVRLIATHEDPEVQAAAQMELDQLASLMDKARALQRAD